MDLICNTNLNNNNNNDSLPLEEIQVTSSHFSEDFFLYIYIMHIFQCFSEDEFFM